MRGLIIGIAAALAALFVLSTWTGAVSAQSPVPGAIFTTLEDGSRVNKNIYASKLDVYLDGGPGPNAPITAAGLPDGNYYFQVTDPSGKFLLSSDPVLCREFRVAGGIIVEYVSAGRTYFAKGQTHPCAVDGKENGLHDTGIDIDHGAVTIQLMPYDNTPNKGGVYKAWATPTPDFVGDPARVDNACGTGCFHGFVPRFSKTDNFKAKEQGRFVTPEILVRKFNDLNGNGVWDADEPEIGVTQFIDGGGWPVSVTDPNTVESNGYTPYSYLPGFAGMYEVEETVLADWSQTAAYLDGVAKPVVPLVPVDVAFVSGETHTVVYGNFQCFTVSGHKYNDLNGNGALDAGEPGIAGWPIYLYVGGVLVQTTKTDADGAYSFTVCSGGAYEVREATPAGWTPITSASFSFTAVSGQDVLGVDFFNFACFTVSGHKYNDVNGNGVKDAEDAGLAGWTIELYRGGTLVASTVTDASGAYAFTVCDPGTYTVKEVQQDGWKPTNPASGASDPFTAVSGLDVTVDFLNFHLGKICGMKWYDADMDGVEDSGESGIAGWRFELVLSGNVVATATTDADGKFCFKDLLPGTYVVREVMPSNPDADHAWQQTFPGGDGTRTVTVVSGTDVQDADFGNVCVFNKGLTWGYWKTHTGFDSPPYDPAYDKLPSNPMKVDLTTPDGNNEINSAAEAKWMFDSTDPKCSGTPEVEKCRSLFRAQLLAVHMNLLKFGDMGSQVYVYPGDPRSGLTVQQIHDDAVALLTDGLQHDFTSFQETLDRINNNGEGARVLVCATPPAPTYP